MSALGRRGLRIDDPIAAGEHRPAGTGDPVSVEARTGQVHDLSLDRIRPNARQPRKNFGEEALVALGESIRERGVLQPVIVRPVDDGFELVAGERRWRAAQLAGQTSIPALIDDTIDATAALEIALIENMVREDLTPIEQARTLTTLLKDLGVSGDRLAKRLGRSRADIVNTVRLLDLPDDAITLIDTGALSKGHGKALLAEPEHHRRRELAREAVEKSWSVRALEAEIARSHRPVRSRPEPDADHYAAAGRLEEALTNRIGGEIHATPHRHGFQIVLDPTAASALAHALGGEITLT